ncbi:ABC transporter permease [Teredinibacter turnerae]|uniref:Transport permease protein n=1 Tax=Teredinibacter turnerae (strain ATCC 39867 / T7901) TaxID=377629 RepID=C5BR58_TERTT|nr:ABC transporter permease [Teredinibacter turnerae]ACR12732.1 ABC-2 type transporter [Teredinibacter turnerae T7901]
MNAAQQLIAYKTIVRKEIRRFMRIWVQTLIPPVITMALYFVIFGSLIGSRIGDMGGFDYMAFVVPGLIMMAIINNSYSNVVSSFYSAKFTKSIEELQVSPTPNYIILLGWVSGGVLRGLAVGSIVTLISMFFTKLHIHNPLVTIAVIVLTSVLFSIAGMINAIYANSFDDISIIPTFVLTPLTYLGGVFYSIDLLPEFWQGVSKLNPVLYMVNAFRYGILGVSDVSVGAAFAGIITFLILMFGFCLYLLNYGKKLRT